MQQHNVHIKRRPANTSETPNKNDIKHLLISFSIQGDEGEPGEKGSVGVMTFSTSAVRISSSFDLWQDVSIWFAAPPSHDRF